MSELKSVKTKAMRENDLLRAQLQRIQERQAKLLEAAKFFERGYNGICCASAEPIGPRDHEPNCPYVKHLATMIDNSVRGSEPCDESQ